VQGETDPAPAARPQPGYLDGWTNS
jgi:hypothetical protein